jgi:hypothetical protein
MAEEDLPPQRRMAVYAAGGGFGGALLAIVVAKILGGPCCCAHEAPDRVQKQPERVSMSIDGESRSTPVLGA